MAKNACRKALSGTLQSLAGENSDIVVITSDARGSVTLKEFVKALPEQFVEAGIAEQDEVGVAAGLALCGKIPFVCAPAAFLSARALEQIKTDVAYSESNVKICAVSGGVSYGALGASHHAVTDLAAIRPLDPVKVMLPCDAYQTACLVRLAAELQGPVYIRMGRNPVEDVYSADDGRQFEVGKSVELTDGEDLTIIAAGEMVHYALEAAEILRREHIRARVVDMFCISPLDKDAILRAGRDTGAILTVEEHCVSGGLGSAVAEYIAEVCPVPMKLLGFPTIHLISGNSEELFEYYGMHAVGIAASALELLGKKEAKKRG